MVIYLGLEEPEEALPISSITTPTSQRGTRRQSYQTYNESNNKHMIPSQSRLYFVRIMLRYGCQLLRN